MPVTELAIERGKSAAVFPIGKYAEYRGWLIGSTFIPIGDSVPDEHWHRVAETFTYFRDDKYKPIVRAHVRRSAILVAPSVDRLLESITIDRVRYYDRYTCVDASYRDSPKLQPRVANVLKVPASGWLSDLEIEVVSLDYRHSAAAIVKLASDVTLPNVEPLSSDDLKWCLRRNYLRESEAFADSVRGPK